MEPPLIAAKGLAPGFYWMIAASIPLSMLGTVVGGRILDRMSDKGFLTWTRYIVTGIGIVYLIQFAGLMLRR